MEGITSFSWETLRTESHQLGEDGKEGQTFLAFTPSAFNGEVLDLELILPKKSRVAVKTFKKNKISDNTAKRSRLSTNCCFSRCRSAYFRHSSPRKIYSHEVHGHYCCKRIKRPAHA